jgi:hypothetical protein
MSWRKTFIDHIADVLRFCGYLFLFLDAIVLSLFAFWCIAKTIWFAARWLDRTIFAYPW